MSRDRLRELILLLAIGLGGGRRKSPLFNHLVGDREHARRNCAAERLGGLEVDHQLELDRLQDRKVGRLCRRILSTKSAERRN